VGRPLPPQVTGALLGRRAGAAACGPVVRSLWSDTPRLQPRGLLAPMDVERLAGRRGYARHPCRASNDQRGGGRAALPGQQRCRERIHPVCAPVAQALPV